MESYTDQTGLSDHQREFLKAIQTEAWINTELRFPGTTLQFAKDVFPNNFNDYFNADGTLRKEENEVRKTFPKELTLEEQLDKALQNKDINLTLALLEKGADVTKQLNSAYTPIELLLSSHNKIQEIDRNIIGLFITKGANVNTNNILSWLIEDENVNMLDWFSKKGLEVNQKIEYEDVKDDGVSYYTVYYYDNSVHIAVCVSLFITKVIIENYNGYLNDTNGREFPIKLAIDKGKWDIVEYLINQDCVLPNILVSYQREKFDDVNSGKSWDIIVNENYETLDNYIMKKGQNLIAQKVNKVLELKRISEKKEWGKLVQLSAQHIQTFPSDEIGYIYQARAYHYLYKIKEAISNRDIILSLNPNNAKMYNLRGLERLMLNEEQLAFEDFSKAIEISPNFWNPYIHRGEIYYKRKDYHRTIMDFSKVISLEKMIIEFESDYRKILSHGYYRMGSIKFHLKDFQGALNDYTKGINQYSSDYRIFQNRGIVKGILKDYDGAMNDLKTAKKLIKNEDSNIHQQIEEAINKLKHEQNINNENI